jgi:DNA-binding XRE family transcriptional regulator
MDDLRVGACIRAERRRRGLRQVEVAAIAGVAQQTVSAVENGRAGDMSVRTVRQICAALGICVELDLKTRGPDLGAWPTPGTQASLPLWSLSSDLPGGLYLSIRSTSTETGDQSTCSPGTQPRVRFFLSK